MQHFIDIDDAPLNLWLKIIERAKNFKTATQYPSYPASVAGLLFYENSTRTRIGFELAAKKLGMPVIQFNPATSAEQKGEDLLDTIKVLCTMGIKYLVLRHKDDNIFKKLEACSQDLHFLNAGTGISAHPSQALLDLMTIMQYKPNLESLKVSIVGNISHSRVAASLQKLFKLVGIKDLFLVAPKIWQQEKPCFGINTDSMEEGLNNSDVIITLRVQKERMDEKFLNLDSYIKQYQLNDKTRSYAKKDVIIMHPGPLNRGVEIANEVADGKHSVILEQIKNGVFLRMAMFEALILKN